MTLPQVASHVAATLQPTIDGAASAAAGATISNLNNPGGAPYAPFTPLLTAPAPPGMFGMVYNALTRPHWIEHELRLTTACPAGTDAIFQLAEVVEETAAISAAIAPFAYATIDALEFTLAVRYAGRGRWWDVWYCTKSSRESHNAAFTALDVRAAINANYLATNPVGDGAAPAVTRELATRGQGFTHFMKHNPVLGGSLRYLIHVRGEAGRDVAANALMGRVMVRAVVTLHVA